MSTKIKGVRDIIIFRKRNISNLKVKSNDSIHTKIKSFQIKYNYLILFVAYYFILLTTKSKVYLKNDSSLYPKDYKFIYMISSVIYKYGKTPSISLNIFPDFNIIYLDFCQIVHFLIITINMGHMNKRSFHNLFYCFFELKLYNSIFLLFRRGILIISSYKIKTSEKKKKEKNKPTDDNKNKSDVIAFIKNIKKQRYGRKKFSIFKNLRNFIIITKYIILLTFFNNIFVSNKISLISYKSYSITLKIKDSGIKKIFSDLSFFPIYSYPNQVYINEKMQDIVNHSYNLTETNNIIELVWDNLINSSYKIFYGCSDIIEMDFSNFNTSNIRDMQWMFRDCSSLISLNLSNFDTSKVTSMNRMFEGCSSLTSLNLSNFDTSQVSYIFSMFNNSINLEYINMINFSENSFEDFNDIFINLPDNIVVCLNKEKVLTQIGSQISNKKCHIDDCTDNWRLNQKKFVEESDECINNCSERNLYEYNGRCISKCQRGDFYYDNNITKCKCELEKCYTCPTVAYNKGICTKCNDNYYPMENDPLNIGEYFNCYNETPEGYYLDEKNSLYKKCYYTCKTCEKNGDGKFHNCSKCNTDFNFEIKTNNYINCYRNCSYFYYFDNNNNYHCTVNLSCPIEYPYLVQNEKQCINEYTNSINLIEKLINDLFDLETNKNITKEEEINKYNEILEKIEYIFTSENFDLTNIDNGEDQIINANKILFTLTNTENQKNNIESNMSTIDLGECETLLREYYNLTNNQTIYMKKLDISQDAMKAKKIEYSVYSKISGNKLEKLNLTICEKAKAKISINIPIEINGNIDQFNMSSGYFNDICYATTSDDGTDISLKDRKSEYINGDNIICQDDCDFSVYDSINKKAKCECYAKEPESSFADMIINKTQLFENLKDIRNLINLNILLCYKKFISFISCFDILHNKGSLIIKIKLNF